RLDYQFGWCDPRIARLVHVFGEILAYEPASDCFLVCQLDMPLNFGAGREVDFPGGGLARRIRIEFKDPEAGCLTADLLPFLVIPDGLHRVVGCQFQRPRARDFGSENEAVGMVAETGD